MVPSPVHNARWMSEVIYVLKCYLFRHQLDLEEHVLEGLRRFALFVSFIYVKFWNWCTNVFNAAANDLQFLKELEKYREIDDELAD